MRITNKLTALLIIALLGSFTSLAVLADASDIDESNSDRDLKSAKRLVYKKKYSSAIKKLNGIVKKGQANADVYNLLGFASRKTGDLETASEAYKKALRKNPKHKGALEYQGELFITQGELGKAQKNLDKLNSLCPSGCAEQEELAAALAAAS